MSLYGHACSGIPAQAHHCTFVLQSLKVRRVALHPRHTVVGTNQKTDARPTAGYDPSWEKLGLSLRIMHRCKHLTQAVSVQTEIGVCDCLDSAMNPSLLRIEWNVVKKHVHPEDAFHQAPQTGQTIQSMDTLILFEWPFWYTFQP